MKCAGTTFLFFIWLRKAGSRPASPPSTSSLLSIVRHLLNVAFSPRSKHLNGSESSLLWVLWLLRWCGVAGERKTSDAAFCHSLWSGMRNIPINQYSRVKEGGGKPLSQVHSTSPFNQIQPNLPLITALFSNAKYTSKAPEGSEEARKSPRSRSVIG